MEPKLFMLLLGATPPERFTEQHDIFFAIGNSLKDLVPTIITFWPNGKGLHIDAWREVNFVDGFQISIVSKPELKNNSKRLFFLNLGGYKKMSLMNSITKMLVVAADKSEAIKQAKQTAFYKHTGYKGAESHIDDKYGIDVDDVYAIEDILNSETKLKYSIQIAPDTEGSEDEINLGYFRLDKL